MKLLRKLALITLMAILPLQTYAANQMRLCSHMDSSAPTVAQGIPVDGSSMPCHGTPKQPTCEDKCVLCHVGTVTAIHPIETMLQSFSPAGFESATLLSFSSHIPDPIQPPPLSLL
jgi:hypothetical protein